MVALVDAGFWGGAWGGGVGVDAAAEGGEDTGDCCDVRFRSRLFAFWGEKMKCDLGV